MEDTYALLSNLVQTKSIERALAPIAAQVSQLIIQNEAYEGGDMDAFPPDLVPSASSVMKTSEGLVQAARRLETDSVDEELKSQMPKACDLLTIAGESMVTAAQRVHMENFNHNSRRHLVRTAKDVLEGTLKVLLVSDDAEVRKIVRSAHWVKDRLGILTAVKSMKHLVPCFKAFTEALMLLTNLADKRQLELINSRRREFIISSMTTLKKCVPMLNSAMQTFVKYNDSQQTAQSKEYVVGQILQCLDEMCLTLENKEIPGCEDMEPEEPGHFVTNVDKVLDYLSEDSRHEMALLGSEFDLVTEATMRHSMAVAHVSSELHRSLIIKNCQRVLRQRTHLSELAKSVNENPSYSELKVDFDDESNRLVEEFQDLERHVNASVLSLIVDVFKETTEPVDRLVKASMSPKLGVGDGQSDATLPESLSPCIESFHNHADKMCQIARFAAASSPDATRVRDIRGCAMQLEQLDPELVPACIACYKNRTSKAAVEHLRMLKSEWASNVHIIMQTIDELTDTKLFLKVSVVEMREDVQRCKESLYCDPTDVAGYARSLIGRGRRVHQMACKLVDSSLDPIYRNGVMVYVQQLNKAIPSVKSSANRVVGAIGELKYHETFHARCETLLKGVSKLFQAIDGKLEPAILDPQREHVRPLEGIQGLGLEDNMVFEYDSDEEKENKAVVNIQTKMKSEREVEVKRKVALKNYIADVVNSHIAELAHAVVSASVAGQQKRVDLLCNEVLARANHISDIANNIAVCTPNDTHKRTLENVASEITELTPQLLDKSSKVVDCDTYQVDPLHAVAEGWISQVSYLETYVDGLIDRWKRVSDKVVDATKMGNVKLLTAQVQRHNTFVKDLVAAASDLVLSSDVYMTEKAWQLKEAVNEFENCTTLLSTMSDVIVNSCKSEEKIQMELQGREWASKVYCITQRIVSLSKTAIERIPTNDVVADFEDSSLVAIKFKDITETSIRLKELARIPRGLSQHHLSSERLSTLVNQLDTLLGNLDECTQLLIHARTPHQTTEKLYAPQTFLLLQWEWAQKCETLLAIVDECTAEYTLCTTQIILAAEDVNAASEEGEADAPNFKLRKAKDEFRQGFMKVKSKVLDAIQMSNAVDKKSEIRRHLEELSTLVTEIEQTGSLIAERKDPNTIKTFKGLQRQWAVRLSQIAELMRCIDNVHKGAVEEALAQLKPTNPIIVSETLEERGKSFVQVIEPTTPSKAITSTSLVNRNVSKLQCPGETGTLTGSLLDFADDLFPASDEDDDDTYHTFRCSVDPNSDEEPHASISVVKISDTPKSSPGTGVESVDEPWKKLSCGPKAQHTTPTRPQTRAQYVPKPVSKSRGGLIFDEKWEDENNAIVKVAKDISRKVEEMEEFVKGIGPIETKEELYQSAKDIAKNSETLVKFSKAMIDLCVDQKLSVNLKTSSEHVPTVIAQLHILSMVKEATPEDRTNEKMLIRTAHNLVGVLNKMLGDVEACCVKGLRQPAEDKIDATEAIVLAARWKRKFERHRKLESNNASTDELGLRKVDRQLKAPHLTQIMLKR